MVEKFGLEKFVAALCGDSSSVSEFDSRALLRWSRASTSSDSPETEKDVEEAVEAWLSRRSKDGVNELNLGL